MGGGIGARITDDILEFRTRVMLFEQSAPGRGHSGTLQNLSQISAFSFIVPEKASFGQSSSTLHGYGGWDVNSPWGIWARGKGWGWTVDPSCMYLFSLIFRVIADPESPCLSNA